METNETRRREKDSLHTHPSQGGQALQEGQARIKKEKPCRRQGAAALKVRGPRSYSEPAPMRRSGMSGEYTQNEARTVMRERREERKGTCMHGAIEVRAINRSKHNDIRHTHIQAPPCCPLTLLLPVSLATNTRIQPQHPATGKCQKGQRLIGLDSAHKRETERTQRVHCGVVTARSHQKS